MIYLKRLFSYLTLLIIVSPIVSFAAPLYVPGETLNPSCVPTNPDCTVAVQSLANFVPYTGATSTLDLGSQYLDVGNIYATSSNFLQLHSIDGLNYTSTGGATVNSSLDKTQIYFSVSDPSNNNSGAQLNFNNSQVFGSFQAADNSTGQLSINSTQAHLDYSNNPSGASGQMTVNPGSVYLYYNGGTLTNSTGQLSINSGQVSTGFNNSANGSSGYMNVYPNEFYTNYSDGSGNYGSLMSQNSSFQTGGTNTTGGYYTLDYEPNFAHFFGQSTTSSTNYDFNLDKNNGLSTQFFTSNNSQGYLSITPSQAQISFNDNSNNSGGIFQISNSQAQSSFFNNSNNSNGSLYINTSGLNASTNDGNGNTSNFSSSYNTLQSNGTDVVNGQHNFYVTPTGAQFGGQSSSSVQNYDFNLDNNGLTINNRDINLSANQFSLNYGGTSTPPVLSSSLTTGDLTIAGNLISKGNSWTAQTVPAANDWKSVTYGNGTYVAVSDSGSSRVMYSSDGVNWKLASSSEQNNWTGVSYGNGLFVAVSTDGTNRAMTSVDGKKWTAVNLPMYSFTSITYGKGTFVAMAGGNIAITSSDGVNWAVNTLPVSNGWPSVTYGNGLFVSVAGGTDIVISPDGINWTVHSAPAGAGWQSVTYGNGLFVAIASGGSFQVMTSPDGINWTGQVAANNNPWWSVTYGNGLFVAVTISQGATEQVMTSPDGINWSTRSVALDGQWVSVTYGNGKFIAIGQGGTNQIMTSGKTDSNIVATNYTDNIYATNTLQFGVPNGYHYYDGTNQNPINIESRLDKTEFFTHFNDPSNNNANGTLTINGEVYGAFQDNKGSNGQVIVTPGEVFSNFFNNDNTDVSNFGSNGFIEIANSEAYLSFNKPSDSSSGNMFVIPQEFGTNFANGLNNGYMFAEDQMFTLSGTDINGDTGIHNMTVSPTGAFMSGLSTTSSPYYSFNIDKDAGLSISFGTTTPFTVLTNGNVTMGKTLNFESVFATSVPAVDPTLRVGYKFETGSTAATTSDYSNNNNEGQVSSMTYFSTGGGDNNGGYYYAPQSTGEISSTSTFNLGTSFTIAFWYKPDTTWAGFPYREMEFGAYNDGWSIMGMDLYINAENNLNMGYTPPQLQWHYYTYTVDGATNVVRFYIDGSEYASSTYTQVLNSNSRTLSINAQHVSAWQAGGSYDDVFIYDRKESSSEVLSDYNAGGYSYSTNVYASPKIFSDVAGNVFVQSATGSAISLTTNYVPYNSSSFGSGFIKSDASGNLFTDVTRYMTIAENTQTFTPTNPQFEWTQPPTVVATTSIPNAVDPHVSDYGTWDGEFFWAGSYDNHTISKIDKNGVLLNTYYLGPNVYPLEQVYDGRYLWIGSADSFGRLIKFDPISATTTATYMIGSGVGGGGIQSVLWDGTYIWVSVANDDKVAKINPSNGSVIASTTGQTAVNGMVINYVTESTGIVEYIWAANYGFVSKIKASDLTYSTSSTMINNPSPYSYRITTDGKYIYTATWSGGNNVNKFDASTTALVASWNAGGNLNTIAFDGKYIWTAGDDQTVTVSDRNLAKVLYSLPGAGRSSLVYDGGDYMWSISRTSPGFVTKIYVGNKSNNMQVANSLTIINETSTSSSLYLSASSTVSSYIMSNLGIGTSTPSATLTISGTPTSTLLRLVNIGAGSLSTDALGNVTVSSDERLKDIQGTFGRGLDDVMKINPISYKWKPETGYDTSNIYSGFSAQNILTAIPEAVGTSSSGYLTLSDRPIIAALVNSIKQIGSVITKIEGGIAYLTNIVVQKFTVGSDVAPSGITMYDRVTKAPYCVSVNNGSISSEPGVCPEIPVINTATVIESLPTIETPVSTTTETASTTPIFEEATSTPVVEEATSTIPVVEEEIATSTPAVEEIIATSTPVIEEIPEPVVEEPVVIDLAPVTEPVNP